MPRPKTIFTQARAFRLRDKRIDKWMETLPHGEVSSLINNLVERYVKEEKIDLTKFEKEMV